MAAFGRFCCRSRRSEERAGLPEVFLSGLLRPLDVAAASLSRWYRYSQRDYVAQKIAVIRLRRDMKGCSTAEQRAAVQAEAVMKAMPTRKPNSAYRSREHLLEREVEALIKAAKGNRNGLRESTIILMMWRHGLRVSEACGLQWSDVSFEDATLPAKH
jgi:integrase